MFEMHCFLCTFDIESVAEGQVMQNDRGYGREGNAWESSDNRKVQKERRIRKSRKRFERM